MEIRFRAWDNTRKEYLSAGEVLISAQPGVRPQHSPTYLDMLDNPDMYANRFVLEPFIGVYAKNKIPIFKGDVVRYRDKVCIVSLHNLQFILNVVNKSCYWDLIDYFTKRINGEYFNDDIEMLGTIHQNPELVEGGK